MASSVDPNRFPSDDLYDIAEAPEVLSGSSPSLTAVVNELKSASPGQASLHEDQPSSLAQYEEDAHLHGEKMTLPPNPRGERVEESSASSKHWEGNDREIESDSDTISLYGGSKASAAAIPVSSEAGEPSRISPVLSRFKGDNEISEAETGGSPISIGSPYEYGQGRRRFFNWTKRFTPTSIPVMQSPAARQRTVRSRRILYTMTVQEYG